MTKIVATRTIYPNGKISTILFVENGPVLVDRLDVVGRHNDVKGHNATIDVTLSGPVVEQFPLRELLCSTAESVQYGRSSYGLDVNVRIGYGTISSKIIQQELRRFTHGWAHVNRLTFRDQLRLWWSLRLKNLAQAWYLFKEIRSGRRCTRTYRTVVCRSAPSDFAPPSKAQVNSGTKGVPDAPVFVIDCSSDCFSEVKDYDPLENSSAARQARSTPPQDGAGPVVKS